MVADSLHPLSSRYAHDYGIRKVLVKAHRQAWVWQDSYHGLTIEDIRELELETQRMLQELYAQVRESRDSHIWCCLSRDAHIWFCQL